MTESHVDATEYHERTKHSPRSVRRSEPGLDFENEPRARKIYEDLPRRSLAERLRPPQVPALSSVAKPGPNGDADPGIDLETLTQLCYYAAGITTRIWRGERELLFRAAACTGALYHVDLYLVTGPVGGLGAGVYHFDPHTLSLDVLREGEYRGVLARATGGLESVADAPVTVVTTSTWWRNAWKYGERTFRHAFWDSGTVLANLLATAHALDRRAEVVLGFADDAVADLVGVDPDHEAPLELVPVGAGESHPAAIDPDPIDPGTRPLSDREVDYPLIHEAWRAGTLADGEAAREWRERADDEPVGTRAAGEGDRIELDPVDPETGSNRPLYETVRRRGSCREYEREPISGRKLSTVLDRAVRGVPMAARHTADRPNGRAPRNDPSLRFTDCYCLVLGVEGVPSGAYQYHPAAGELEQLRDGEFRREAAHLALDQRLGGDAAACLYFMTDLGEIVGKFGDRGYRLAGVEASTTVGRLYLATYAHRDLGGTGLTFYDDLVTDFFSPRATGQTPMFLYTLGRPA